MRPWICVALLLGLVACNFQPAPTPRPQRTLGLIEVTIDLRDEANPSASANFIPWFKVTSQVSAQAITGFDHDIQLKRKEVSFMDSGDSPPYTNPTRYISATFLIANRSCCDYSNLSFLATGFASGPFTTKNGTTFTGLSNGTGATIADNATFPGGVNIYRGIVPTHAMRRNAGLNDPLVDPSSADLQYFTPNEAHKVQNDLATPYPAAQVLGYGFVARNLTGGRFIQNVSNLCDVETDFNCFGGHVTLAFKFPRMSPRNTNPFTFTMVFLVADETDAYISQSVEEQFFNTAAGTGGLPGVFSQVRTLYGNSYGGALENYVCSVRTAVPTAGFPGNLYLPTYIPSAPGSLDLCFGGGGKVTTDFASSEDAGYSLALQSDGKMVVAGSSFSGTNNFALVRYNHSGSLDTTFGAGGKVTTDFASSTDQVNALAIQSDGKIVVAGVSVSDFALARYNPSGSLDTTFDTDGKVTTSIGPFYDEARAVALQGDGKIVLAGRSFNGSNNDFTLVRYNPNGSLDTGFGSGGIVITGIGSGSEMANSLAIQSDNKIVVAGCALCDAGAFFALVRYNPNGSPDTTFDSDGIVMTAIGTSNDVAHSLAIQSDGKIVAAGYSTGSNRDFALARYNPNGSLDTTFDSDGKVTTAIGTSTDEAHSLALQSDGKIVLGGHIFNGSSNDFTLVRYNSGGSLDTSFGTGGKVTTSFGSLNDEARSLVIQSDGKIVLGGYAFISGYDFALARYNP